MTKFVRAFFLLRLTRQAQNESEKRYGEFHGFEYVVLTSLSQAFATIYEKKGKKTAFLQAAFHCLDFARDLGNTEHLPSIYYTV